MAQTEPNLQDYWWVIRRRKWIVLSVPLLLGIATYVTTQLQAPAPLYKATAVARFERSFNVNTLLLRDIVGVSPIGDLETNAALVKSFPVLNRAAKKLGLIPMSTDPRAERAASAEQAAIQKLSADIDVTRKERTSLIEITATAFHPDEAARIANTVADAFRENDIETRTYQVVEARRFIETQLVDVGRRLRESEERLRTFQEANKIVMLQDEARVAIGRLAEQQGERERIERDIRAVQVQARVLTEAKASDASRALVGSGGDSNLGKLETALSDLMIERATLLLTLRPNHPQVRGVDAKIHNVQRELDDVVAANRAKTLKALSSQLQVLRARSAQVAGAIGELSAKTSALPAVALEAARIEREVRVNERIFSLLKERLQEALIKEKEQVAEVTIVKPALTTPTPVNEPEAGRRAFIGLVLGGALGLLLAFVVEALDTSIGAIHDLEALLETPIVGVIPHLDPSTVAAFPILFAPRSPIAEAIRGLRTNLLFKALDRNVKTLIVTSTAQAEGKTTIAMNLAIALAQLGKRTLLVEADLRNPSIHQVLGSRRGPGVTDVVLGSASLEDATLDFAHLTLGTAGRDPLAESPGTDNFFFLPSGLRAPNPSELIGSSGFTALLAAARERYDYLVLDSAPVLSVADASILASQADGVLCVARVGYVPRAALRRAKAMLDATRTPLLGVCLNGVSAEVSPDFQELAYYKYEYGRGSTKAPAQLKIGALWGAQAWTARGLVGAIVAAVVLGIGLWAVSRTSTRSPSSEPVAASPEGLASRDRGAPVANPTPPHPEARDAGPARESYSVECPVGENASGRVLIGEFSTKAETIAFGEELVRAGIIPTFRVVAAERP
jgi:capsular exopolysaccharide synthesis family protein